MNEEEKDFCEYWLRFPTTLYTKLASPIFPVDALKKMIEYEIDTRKRLPVIDRLLGRYYKLIRKNVFKEVENDIGKGDRAVPSSTSSKARWPGN